MKGRKAMTWNNIATPFIFGMTLAGLGLGAQNSASAAGYITLTHVHGLTYSQDGKNLFIPSHDGLAVYRGGRWSKAAGPQHDYMGFTGTREYFYSSGHPAPGSGMVNPFGLLKSNDGGQTWRKLGLEGESDFHLLAAGYETNAIYVYNAGPNSRMRSSGIYRTRNDGFSWERAEASGLKGKVLSLAVHPADAAVVAVGTDAGLFLSADQGIHFKPLAKGQRALSVFFELDGQHLWWGSFDVSPRLYRLNVHASKQEAVLLPSLTQDAVAYIAQNPVNRSEMAIATFERSVFISEDRGKTWRQLAQGGQTR